MLAYLFSYEAPEDARTGIMRFVMKQHRIMFSNAAFLYLDRLNEHFCERLFHRLGLMYHEDIEDVEDAEHLA